MNSTIFTIAHPSTTDREAHADTVTLFVECAAGKYEAFTSDYAIDELEMEVIDDEKTRYNTGRDTRDTQQN